MKRLLIKKTFVVIFSLNLLLTSFLSLFLSPIIATPAYASSGSSCQAGSVNSIASNGSDMTNTNSQVGGVALNQAATFLANMSNVTGAYYDQSTNRIVFIGQENAQLPQFNKDDLAVAIKAVFFNKTLPSISIETPDSNGMMPVIYTGGIENTRFGQTLFDADLNLKHYASGYDINGNRLSTSVAGYEPIMERYLDKTSNPQGPFGFRFWINPQLIQLNEDTTSNSFVFSNVTMQVSYEALLQNDPKLDQAGQEFATQMTQHYDDYAAETPSWVEAKQLAEIVGVVKWISDNGINTDFQWASDYTPTYVATPQQVPAQTLNETYNGIQYTMTGGVHYYTPNSYSSANGTATTLKDASQAVNAPKEQVHWTFNSNGQQYDAVAVAADAFQSLGAYSTSATDMSFPTVGNQNLQFVRTYTSFSNGQKGVGRGWSDLPATLSDNLTLAGGNVAIARCGTIQNDFSKRAFLAFTLGGSRETFSYQGVQNGCAYVADDPSYHSNITVNRINSTTNEYTVTLKDQTKYIFDEYLQNDGNTPQIKSGYAFNLIKVQDKNGNNINYGYDSQNKLSSISDDNNHTISITYNTNNLISQISDWTNRTVSYTYDDQGNLLTSTDPMGNTTTYTYDSNYRLTAIQDRNGNTILTNTYTPEAKVATQTNTGGVTNTYTYNETNKQITATDNLGRTNSVTYDDKARILTNKNPLNFTTTYTYGVENAPLTVTDSYNHTLTNTYDSNGNLTSTTDPNNKTVGYQYDSKNDITQISDGRYAPAKVTTLGYDSNGNLTSTDEDGRETLFSYYPNGKLNGEWDPLNHLTYWGYDSFGNKTSETDANNKTTFYYYDSLGRLYWQTDPNNKSTAFSYDNDNNVTGKWDAIGTSDEAPTYYYYDKENRLKKTILPNNGETDFAYNSSGSLNSVTDPNTNLTSYGYDQYQNLTSKQDALDRTTQYEYDQLNQKKQATTPLGEVTKWEYDGNGNLTKRFDSDNRETDYQYDSLNRLDQITYPDSTTVNYTYDDRGNLLTMVDPTGTTTYTYDNFNRLTGVTDPNNQTVSYEYDPANNLTKITYPNGRYIAYTYNDRNQLENVSDWNGSNITYQYNDNGTLASRNLPNGITTNYSYDNANRLVGVQHEQGDTPIATYSYIRDHMGNITTASESAVLSSTPIIPPAAMDYSVYDEGLATGWSDWSWSSTNDFNDTTNPYSGSKDISWTANSGYAGLKFHKDGNFDTTGYENLTLALQASQTGQTTQVQLYDTNDALIGNPVELSDYGGEPVPGSYKVYNIPLTALGGANQQIGGVLIQDVSGTSEPPMYVDKVGFTAPQTSTEILSSNWNFSTDNGSTEHNEGIPSNSLAGKTSAQITFNLHGHSFGGGDDEASVIFVQGDWMAVNLTQYGQNGLDGDQTVTVPLTDFHKVGDSSVHLDPTQTVSDLHARFWSDSPYNVDISSVKLIGSGSTPTPYTAEYWNSGTGSSPDMPTGTADLTRTEDSVSMNGTPDASIGPDHFIARWTKTDHFDAGLYRFVTSVDDGARLYIDDQLVLDAWKDEGLTTYPVYQQLSAGNHTIKLEYYQNGGGASAYLGYDLMSPPTTETTTYSYDSLGRLTGALLPDGTQYNYNYDAVGNRLTSSIGGQQSTYTYNNDNQLTAKDSATYTYDDNGNRSSVTQNSVTKAQSYNFDNRLTDFTDPTSSTAMHFTYDANGNRLAEDVNNATVEQYVNDISGGMPRVLDAKDAVNNHDTYYIYGAGLVSQSVGDEWGREYFLDDGLGNVRYVLDGTDNNVQEYKYDPYGNQLVGGDATNFQYRAQQMDADTGLYYLRARYYDPTTGTFTSRDPLNGNLMNPQTFNGYNYANGNPVNLTDPSGKGPELAAFAFGPEVGACVVVGAVGITLATNPSARNAVGTAIAGAINGISTLLNKSSSSTQSDSSSSQPSNFDPSEWVKNNFNNPQSGPDGWDAYRYGPGPNDVNYSNPNVDKENLSPDLEHGAPEGPHWDYTDPTGNKFRIYPDGSMVPK